jgi:hypothetical protein
MGFCLFTLKGRSSWTCFLNVARTHSIALNSFFHGEVTVHLHCQSPVAAGLCLTGAYGPLSMPVVLLKSPLWFCWFTFWESDFFCRQVFSFFFVFPGTVHHGISHSASPLEWMTLSLSPAHPCGLVGLDHTDASLPPTPPSMGHRGGTLVSTDRLHTGTPIPTDLTLEVCTWPASLSL